MNKLQSPKSILIIDNYDSFTYNLYQIVAQHCNTVQVIRNDKITIEEIRQMAPAGIILSPGPGRPEDAGLCVELIQSMAHQIPILGVCLGHQAIAVAFGAKVVVMNEVAHGKKTTVFHQGQHLFQSMPLPFVAGRYHSLGVERDSLPNTLLIQAENDQRIIMAIKHCEFPTYGVQFHPESILTPEGNRIVEEFLKVCDLGST